MPPQKDLSLEGGTPTPKPAATFFTPIFGPQKRASAGRQGWPGVRVPWDSPTVAPGANRASQRPKAVASQRVFQAVPPPVYAAGPSHSILPGDPTYSCLPPPPPTPTRPPLTGPQRSRSPTPPPRPNAPPPTGSAPLLYPSGSRSPGSAPAGRSFQRSETRRPGCSMPIGNSSRPDDTNWTGAEIRSCCRVASLLDVPLVQATQNVVPVAVTASDKIEGLRHWASGRCLSADRGEVYSRPDVGGGKVRRVVRAD